MTHLPLLDLLVLGVYLAGTVGLGSYFVLRNRTSDHFMAGGRDMSGVVVGLSIFGTYLSSISFLAIPGKAAVSNWAYLAFCVSVLPAAYIAVRYFIPYYRTGDAVSAYAHLEDRFGPWARVYAATCYILMQVARVGVVMYLLALPLSVLLGWDIRWIIVVTGVLTTLYTCLGGIEGVIWTDAVQAVVLMLGAVVCAATLMFDMPGGPGQLFSVANAGHKFSLGSFSPDLKTETFWVVLLFGLVTNLQNFGVDQGYVQRYVASRSEREARKSVWLASLLYPPVALLFLFIGAGLYARYTVSPELLPPALHAEFTRAGKGDNLFPYFIVNRLPVGVTGLLIAAIFAAAMSTLSTSLNSSATLTLTDFYKRFFRPQAGNREQLVVLYGSTAFWGILGTGVALATLGAKSALDTSWELAGFFSGGLVGLFLLGFISRRARNPEAIAATLLGVLVIFWMALSRTDVWPADLGRFRNPLHKFMTLVVGTLTILLVGLLLSRLRGRVVPPPSPAHRSLADEPS